MGTFITTTESKKWAKGVTTDKKGITLSFGEEKQTIRGFGSCFSELAKIAIETLPKKEQEKVYDDFFNKEGLNFNYCRIPIGSSDFAYGYYSCDDFDGDFNMEKFNLDRDKEYLIPFILESVKRRDDMQYFACPWCPPVWMKTFKTFSFGVFRHEPKYLKAYALYFRKFVEGYRDLGIKINQVLPQNEPCSNQPFPSCVWTGEELANFIGGYLGKELDGLCDIIFGSINGPETDDRRLYTRYSDYLGVAMQDKKAKKYIKGAGYQWAGKYALQTTRDDYPDLEIIMTESECGDGDNSFDQCMYIFEMARHFFRNGASAYVYWNFALGEDAISTWGWKQNSLITVKDGKVIKNPEYYLMKHFSKFIERGAKYIESKGEFASNTACFINPDGTKIVAVYNPFKEEKIITVENKNYVLPARSINTIVI